MEIADGRCEIALKDKSSQTSDSGRAESRVSAGTRSVKLESLLFPNRIAVGGVAERGVRRGTTDFIGVVDLTGVVSCWSGATSINQHEYQNS